MLAAGHHANISLWGFCAHSSGMAQSLPLNARYTAGPGAPSLARRPSVRVAVAAPQRLPANVRGVGRLWSAGHRPPARRRCGLRAASVPAALARPSLPRSWTWHTQWTQPSMPSKREAAARLHARPVAEPAAVTAFKRPRACRRFCIPPCCPIFKCIQPSHHPPNRAPHPAAAASST